MDNNKRILTEENLKTTINPIAYVICYWIVVFATKLLFTGS